MQTLLQIEQDILASGEVDGDHLEALRVALSARDGIDRPAADSLVELHRRVRYPTRGSNSSSTGPSRIMS